MRFDLSLQDIAQVPFIIIIIISVCVCVFFL